MKNKLLALLMLSLTVFHLRAQSPLELYTDLHDSLDNMWNGSVTCTFSKIKETANAFEGDSVLKLTYNVSTGNGWYAGFGGDLNGTTGLDFSGYSYFIVSGKGTSADYPNNKLMLAFVDGNDDKSYEFEIATIGSSYITRTFSLVDDVKNDSVDFDLNNVKKFYMYVKDLYGQYQPNNSVFYLDGIKLSTTPATSVGSALDKADVLIAPNPSSGIYSVNSSKPVERLVVSDCLGNIVFKDIDNPSTIDLTNQPDGLFFVTLSSNDKVVTKKLIKGK